MEALSRTWPHSHQLQFFLSVNTKFHFGAWDRFLSRTQINLQIVIMNLHTKNSKKQCARKAFKKLLYSFTPCPVLPLVNCCYVPVMTFYTWKFAGFFPYIQTTLNFLKQRRRIFFFLTLFFHDYRYALWNLKGNYFHIYLVNSDRSGVMMCNFSSHNFSKKHKTEPERKHLGCSIWWDHPINERWAESERVGVFCFYQNTTHLGLRPCSNIN